MLSVDLLLNGRLQRRLCDTLKTPFTTWWPKLATSALGKLRQGGGGFEVNVVHLERKV